MAKKKKRKKAKFPSKREIIEILLKEFPKEKKIDKLMLIIEHKKVSIQLGVIKAELIKNGKAVLKGSMTCFPETLEDSFDWDKLKPSQSYFAGYSLDYQGESIFSMVKQGIKKAIKEGRIPFSKK